MQLSQQCKAILSGDRQDAIAGAARCVLSALGFGYGFIMRGRNGLYNSGWLKQATLHAKVVCVGNITVGGTGKTPMVLWLAQRLEQRGRRIAILTRGYKGTGNDGDEVRLFRAALPSVPVVVDSNRVRGGQCAIDEHGADVLLLDDGFQHRRLARDWDIVLIDCLCPFGYDAVLPRGLLREPLEGLARAQAVILTRSDLVDAAALAAIRKRIEKLTPAAVIYTSRHQVTQLMTARNERLDAAMLRGENVAAVCGIGHPEAFVGTLKQLGATVNRHCFYNDHHPYAQSDVEKLAALAQHCRWLVTTEKDWVKLSRLPGAADLEKLVRLQIEAVVDDGEALVKQVVLV